MTDSCTLEQISGVFTDSTLFSNCGIDPGLKISVILPVRNEEENLIRALDALRLQVDGSGKPLSGSIYEVLLLANNCADRSVSIARDYQLQFPDFALHVEEITLDKSVAHIGTVRRLLMDAAYRRLTKLNKNGIIASTDSDSEVGSLWICQTLLEIENGNDVVGGRIFTKPDNSISRLYYLRDITYKHLVSRLEDLLDPVSYDPWPRHFQCFGASFAVTCSIYDLSGRLPAIPFLEDMAFHKSLIRVDAKIRLSPFVQVLTSARTEGKVDFGLSIQLKQWGEMNTCNHPMMVEQAGSVILKLKARKILREFWNKAGEDFNFPGSGIPEKVSALLGLNHDWICQQIGSAQYFGKLWENIEDRLNQEGWASAWPARNVVDVIPELKREIAGITN